MGEACRLDPARSRAARARGVLVLALGALHPAATWQPGEASTLPAPSVRRPDIATGLLADTSVYALAQEIGMAVMAGVLLDHVDKKLP
jgi:hypothetical protein